MISQKENEELWKQAVEKCYQDRNFIKLPKNTRLLRIEHAYAKLWETLTGQTYRRN